MCVICVFSNINGFVDFAYSVNYVSSQTVSTVVQSQVSWWFQEYITISGGFSSASFTSITVSETIRVITIVAGIETEGRSHDFCNLVPQTKKCAPFAW